MEWLLQLIALAIALIVALMKSFRAEPSSLSEFELGRRADEGDQTAAYELQRRPLLRAIEGLAHLKTFVAQAVLAVLLFATHEPLAAFLWLLLYLAVTEVVTGFGWLRGAAMALDRAIGPSVIGAIKVLAPLLQLFAHKTHAVADTGLASREELAQLIDKDNRVLGAAEKARLQGALQFNDLKVADVMVPREKIVTVGVSETVGPVLLDRLHKVGHNVFVVVKKDLDHIQGLLYMHDVAEPDPELKTVKDAVRPSVHYIAGHQPLSTVLSASLQSGRQLFIVVDDNGNTQGLITLQDALVKLLGTAPPDETYTSTDPKKVKRT